MQNSKIKVKSREKIKMKKSTFNLFRIKIKIMSKTRNDKS